MIRRVAVLSMAVALDLALGELPNRYHPVAWLGNGMTRARGGLQQRFGTSRAIPGMALAIGPVALATVFALLARRLVGRAGLAGLLLEACVLKQALSIRALFAHARAVERLLASDDLSGARAAAGQMVSRSTSTLGADGVASAAIESLAENSSDSVVAPAAWYLLAGLPGAFAYRAINTLDAVTGYREYAMLGTPSARLDDAANFIPARATAALIAGVSHRPISAGRLMRDARSTPSPNAGWPMAAAAHALGIRLEKPGHHVLNAEGRAPRARDITRARRLLQRALVLGGSACLATLCLRVGWRR